MFGITLKKKVEAVPVIEVPQNKHTPDILRLQQRANWLVFLYCDLQHGHEREIDQSDLVWWGFTQHNYSMWRNDLGKLTHPLAFPWDPRLTTVYHNRIKGQIVRMRTDRLISLDEERFNGVQFERVRVPITVPHTVLVPSKDRCANEKFNDPGYIKGDYSAFPAEQTVWAWTYLGHRDFWLDLPVRVSPMITLQKDGTTLKEFLMKVGDKVTPSANRYIPNNAKNEPYYYFPPNS